MNGPSRGIVRKQRGVAVVTALLLTTLAITIVASLFWQQQVQVRSIENQRLQLQKQWILRGALDWARLILREDAKYSSADTLEEPWAVPLSETRLDQYVENGRADADAADATLSGSIIDAQSRYNLTNLAIGGAINRAEVAVFERLLSNLRLNPSLALATAEAMATAQRQSGTTQQSTQGGQQAQQSQQSSGTRPLQMVYVEDLLSVPGFTPEMIAKLREMVIFLPRVTPVNANTASAEVLAARIDTLSLSDATVLVNARKTASFRDIGDISNRLSGRGGSLSGNDLAVATSFFLVNGRVRMNRAGLEVQALIERNGANTRLIWVREN